MVTQKLETHTVNTWLQIILMSITSLLITIIIALNLQQFEAFEPKSIEIGTPETKITEQTKNIPQIESGLFVREISELNLNAGTLTANLLIWFYFNPKLVDPELVSKFTFERAEEKFRSDPMIEINKPDEYFVKYNVRLKCAMPFNYEDFPVDDHRIDFIITNYFLDATKVGFKTDNSLITLHQNVNLQGWRIVGRAAHAGYLKNILNPHNTQQVVYNPREVFGFDLERDGIRQVLSTILPLLLIFFTALFTFAINPSGADFTHVELFTTRLPRLLEPFFDLRLHVSGKVE